MIINVKYSYKKEENNYLDSLYSFRWNKHGRNNIQNDLLKPFPEQFKNNLLKAKGENEARKVIKEFIIPYLPNRKISYKHLAITIEKVWTSRKSDIIKQLEDIYGETFPFNKITVYLSSLPICPYNYKDKWFMLYANTPIDRQMSIIKHELNHFMFYYYFPTKELCLDNNKYESLKEALTVLSNEEEVGYPNQQKIRAWLSKQKGTVKQILQNPEWKQCI